mmetsp:Transcript_11713/g.27367  ORF Transcript_11713/g.27367 Transcript_11713/m.27367 type:complete len:245 (-) Transcript_11713:117-851(-)
MWFCNGRSSCKFASLPPGLAHATRPSLSTSTTERMLAISSDGSFCKTTKSAKFPASTLPRFSPRPSASWPLDVAAFKTSSGLRPARCSASISANIDIPCVCSGAPAPDPTTTGIPAMYTLKTFLSPTWRCAAKRARNGSRSTARLRGFGGKAESRAASSKFLFPAGPGCDSAPLSVSAAPVSAATVSTNPVSAAPVSTLPVPPSNIGFADTAAADTGSEDTGLADTGKRPRRSNASSAPTTCVS